MWAHGVAIGVSVSVHVGVLAQVPIDLLASFPSAGNSLPLNTVPGVPSGVRACACLSLCPPCRALTVVVSWALSFP